MRSLTRRAAFAGAAALSLRALAGDDFAEDQAQAAQSGEFPQFLESMWPKAQAAGVSRATFDAAINGLTPDPAILSRPTRQAEFTITIAQYVAQSVTQKRAAQGRDAAAKLADALQQIQARNGIPWEILVALWGIESNFGTTAGNSDILRVLATLAFKQHRGSLFLDEFVAALVMLEKGYATRAHLVGSWAGAMGQPQFMPSSYLNYAVAYEGSRPADIWSSNKDVLASIGNFMQKSGWVSGLPWGMEVVIPGSFDYISLRKPFAEWQAQGFRAASGKKLPNEGDAGLYMPAGAKGPAWLITDNFFVIKQYNTSDAYALSVGLLAQQIANEGGIRAPWPKDFKALSTSDGKSAQQALTKLGLYRGNIDGKIGPAMRDAVHSYQIKAGIMPADGFITPALVQRLKSETGL
ncbi:MAG: lytic murein transglycosylase [Methylobacteriaceae bacterium]|nr:lytic murein transglycosylase [Methylobacteriaceae bacterium]